MKPVHVVICRHVCTVANIVPSDCIESTTVLSDQMSNNAKTVQSRRRMANRSFSLTHRRWLHFP